MEYVDLELTELNREASNRWTIEARSRFAGVARGTLELDLAAMEKEVSNLYASSRSTRLGVIGQMLYRATFQDRIERILTNTRARLDHDQGLRVILRFQDPDLAELPWELLNDPDGSTQFMGLSARTPILRCLATLQSESVPQINKVIRILFISAEPSDYPKLDLKNEITHIQGTLEPLIRDHLITMDYLPNATKSTLRGSLVQKYDVFHFMGHGSFDRVKGGILLLEDDLGKGELIDTAELAILLGDNELQLVILNACQTATLSGLGSVWSMSSQLARIGIPAVIGMREKISDGSALTFTTVLYETLATSLPVEIAVTEARKALMLKRGLTAPDWSCPVLFTRLFAENQGIVFNPGAVAARQPFVQWNIAVRAKFENSIDRQTLDALDQQLTLVFNLLRAAGLEADIQFQRPLGDTLELVAPENTLILEPPVFQWKVGKEILEISKNAALRSGTTVVLQAQVKIQKGIETVWQSELKRYELGIAFDLETEAERVYGISCPTAVYEMLSSEQKYSWRLYLEYSKLDLDKRLVQESEVVRTVFGVLGNDAQRYLAAMLLSLPKQGVQDPQSALLMGAVYEAYGIYDKAITAYQSALVAPQLQKDVFRRLTGLNEKQAYQLLTLPGEVKATRPNPKFAWQANYYRALAQRI